MAKIQQHTLNITPMVIELYIKDRLTPTFIANQLNTSEFTVRKILKRNKIEIRGHLDAHRKFNLNENVFKNKEFKEYWCGLLLSDGHVHQDDRRNNSYYIRITLKRQDKHILDEFKEFLEYGGDVKYDENKTYLYISSQEIYFDLQDLGINETKTYNTKIHDTFKNNKLFWRGYLDGDGSIYFSSDNKIRLSLGSACRKTIEIFHQFCCQFTDTTANVDDTYTKNIEPFYRITYGGIHAKRILDEIYSCEGPKLLRKYNLYKDYINALV